MLKVMLKYYYLYIGIYIFITLYQVPKRITVIQCLNDCVGCK